MSTVVVGGSDPSKVRPVSGRAARRKRPEVGRVEVYPSLYGPWFPDTTSTYSKDPPRVSTSPTPTVIVTAPTVSVVGVNTWTTVHRRTCLPREPRPDYSRTSLLGGWSPGAPVRSWRSSTPEVGPGGLQRHYDNDFLQTPYTVLGGLRRVDAHRLRPRRPVGK